MIDANLEIWIFHVHHYLAPDLEFPGPLSCFSKTLLSGRKSQACVSRASPPDVLHISPPPPPTPACLDTKHDHDPYNVHVMPPRWRRSVDGSGVSSRRRCLILLAVRLSRILESVSAALPDIISPTAGPVPGGRTT